jgi:hypothetical protein
MFLIFIHIMYCFCCHPAHPQCAALSPPSVSFSCCPTSLSSHQSSAKYAIRNREKCRVEFSLANTTNISCVCNLEHVIQYECITHFTTFVLHTGARVSACRACVHVFVIHRRVVCVCACVSYHAGTIVRGICDTGANVGIVCIRVSTAHVQRCELCARVCVCAIHSC